MYSTVLMHPCHALLWRSTGLWRNFQASSIEVAWRTPPNCCTLFISPPTQQISSDLHYSSTTTTCLRNTVAKYVVPASSGRYSNLPNFIHGKKTDAIRSDGWAGSGSTLEDCKACDQYLAEIERNMLQSLSHAPAAWLPVNSR